MNYIALTGSDMRAMATVAEILLEETVAHGPPLAILLHVNQLHQAIAIRTHMHRNDYGELWRVGLDPHHRQLDPLVDHCLPGPERYRVTAALQDFRIRLENTQAFSPSDLETSP